MRKKMLAIMNAKSGLTTSAAIFLITLFNSCSCDCWCEKNLGCTILTVKLKSNDSLVVSQIYCSQTNYSSDLILRDSITEFYARYSSDTTAISSRDSIYTHEQRIENLSCKESDPYIKNGYNCECAK